MPPIQKKTVAGVLYLLRAGESAIDETSDSLNPDEIVEPQLAINPTVRTMVLTLKFWDNKAGIPKGCIQVSDFLVSTTLPGYQAKEFILPFPVQVEQVSARLHVADEEVGNHAFFLDLS